MASNGKHKVSEADDLKNSVCKKKINMLTNFNELIYSNDPNLLLEASITSDLYCIVRKNANGVEISKMDDIYDDVTTQSVLLCWFGIFEFRKATDFGNQRARHLLQQAIYSPIALYLLGLLAESDIDAGVTNNNMKPEEYYKAAINFEPFKCNGLLINYQFH